MFVSGGDKHRTEKEENIATPLPWRPCRILTLELDHIECGLSILSHLQHRTEYRFFSFHQGLSSPTGVLSVLLTHFAS